MLLKVFRSAKRHLFLRLVIVIRSMSRRKQGKIVEYRRGSPFEF